MDDLSEKVEKFMSSIARYNSSLSKYITTIVELVEAGASKETVIEHLHNIQRVMQKMQKDKNGQNS